MANIYIVCLAADQRMGELYLYIYIHQHSFFHSNRIELIRSFSLCSLYKDNLPEQNWEWLNCGGGAGCGLYARLLDGRHRKAQRVHPPNRKDYYVFVAVLINDPGRVSSGLRSYQQHPSASFSSIPFPPHESLLSATEYIRIDAFAACALKVQREYYFPFECHSNLNMGWLSGRASIGNMNISESWMLLFWRLKDIHFCSMRNKALPTKLIIHILLSLHIVWLHAEDPCCKDLLVKAWDSPILFPLYYFQFPSTATKAKHKNNINSIISLHFLGGNDWKYTHTLSPLTNFSNNTNFHYDFPFT